MASHHQHSADPAPFGLPHNPPGALIRRQLHRPINPDHATRLHEGFRHIDDLRARQNQLPDDLAAIRHGVLWGLAAVALIVVIMFGPQWVEAVLL
jgi:hypothetical protein